MLQPVVCGLMLQEDRGFVLAFFRCVTKVCSRLFDREEPDEERKVSGTFRSRVMEWIKERWRVVREVGRRDMCNFIEVIPQCQDSFPIMEYNDFFLNEMASIIKSGSKEAKRLASVAFCTLFLKNYLSASRSAALGKVLCMAKSDTCFERLGLLTFVEVALQNFSRRFLSDQGILKVYLSMGEDKVANVRIKFASMSLKVNKAISREEDRKQLRLLLSLHENDLDKDVRRLSKETSQALKQALPLPKAEETDNAARERRELDLVAQEKMVRFMFLLPLIV